MIHNLPGYYIPFIVITRCWLYIPCIVHYILVAYFIPSFRFYLRLCWVFAVAVGSSLLPRGLRCCRGLFSSCNERGLLSGCGAQASPCSGSSLRRTGTWALRHQLHGCGAQAELLLHDVESSRVRAHVCCTGRWIPDLSHQGSRSA